MVSWFVYKYDGDEDKRICMSACGRDTEANKLGLVVADDVDDDCDGTSAQGDGSNGW